MLFAGACGVLRWFSIKNIRKTLRRTSIDDYRFAITGLWITTIAPSFWCVLVPILGVCVNISFVYVVWSLATWRSCESLRFEQHGIWRCLWHTIWFCNYRRTLSSLTYTYFTSYFIIPVVAIQHLTFNGPGFISKEPLRNFLHSHTLRNLARLNLRRCRWPSKSDIRFR